MFSSELCEISKNTLFTEHLRATASKNRLSLICLCKVKLMKANRLAYYKTAYQYYHQKKDQRAMKTDETVRRKDKIF